MCYCWDSEKNPGVAVTGSQRESDKPLYKSASCNLGVVHVREIHVNAAYRRYGMPLEVCLLCVRVCVRSCLCKRVCVCAHERMIDQRRWATDRARHPGTIQVHIKALALPLLFLDSPHAPPLFLLSSSYSIRHTHISSQWQTPIYYENY